MARGNLRRTPSSWMTITERWNSRDRWLEERFVHGDTFDVLLSDSRGTALEMWQQDHVNVVSNSMSIQRVLVYAIIPQ